MDFDEFNETHLMLSLIVEVCILSLFYFCSIFLAILHMVRLKYDVYVKLALLQVVLLTLLIYLGRSMLMALTSLLRSAF